MRTEVSDYSKKHIALIKRKLCQLKERYEQEHNEGRRLPPSQIHDLLNQKFNLKEPDSEPYSVSHSKESKKVAENIPDKTRNTIKALFDPDEEIKSGHIDITYIAYLCKLFNADQRQFSFKYELLRT